MNWRWVTVWALLAGLAAAGSEGGEAREDELPEALDDDDDSELSLHEEESRNLQPRAYTQQAAAAYNALPSGVLLQQSRFDCGAKQTGYYADEELQCEVFHYCQDGVKHSWICPDGFTFHQVHLICMPPTHDNICQQSKKYHFVNEYLYRPVNTEEAAKKPNTPLRYSERYYPAEVYHDERREFYDEDDEEQEEPTRPAVRPTPAAAPPRPAAPAPAQVFRSAEEVNIPLLQRRPQPQRPYEFRF
ncbi:chitin binding peritrophin-A domain-containing protein [Phthorimaea operculella]|nr:chitin binding peritrophin-A domain-containing protein [Phthorimaea operculella]